MEKVKSIHKVNCKNKKPSQFGESEDKSIRVKKAVMGIIEDISIENGSFKSLFTTETPENALKYKTRF